MKFDEGIWLRMPVSAGSKQSASISQPRSRAFSSGMFTEMSIISFSKRCPYLRNLRSQADMRKPMDCFSSVERYCAKSWIIVSMIVRWSARVDLLTCCLRRESEPKGSMRPPSR